MVECAIEARGMQLAILLPLNQLWPQRRGGQKNSACSTKCLLYKMYARSEGTISHPWCKLIAVLEERIRTSQVRPSDPGDQ